MPKPRVPPVAAWFLLTATTACVLFFFSPLAVHAQTSASTAPQLAEATTPLRLEAVFTDEEGRFIEGVRAEDLRLYVNGVEQKVSSVEVEIKPVTYGLVVDNSGSLRSQMGAIAITAQGFIANNRTGDETFVVRFVTSDRINILQGITGDAIALRQSINKMYVEGGATALIDALYLSVEHLLKERPREANRRRALILISDGEDRQSHYKLEQLLKLLRSTGIQLFCIGFVAELDKEQGLIMKSKRDRAKTLLRRLAAETGGVAFFPEKVSQLQDSFAQVVKHLRATRFSSRPSLRFGPRTFTRLN
jgi:Ca-activated chloride channel family protein